MNEIRPIEIKKLRNYYISHLILYLILIIFNFLLLIKIIWIQKSLYYIFLCGSFFSLLYIIIPIIPFSFVLLKKLNKKYIKSFRQTTFIFCIITVILGLFFSVVLMINVIDASDFCKECAFNLPLPSVLTEDVCDKKRCILNTENPDNQYSYEYICNFDPIILFEENKGYFRRMINDTYQVTSEYQIICERFELNNSIIENEIINKYINICNNKDEYYVCQRFFEHKKYKLEENYNCPDEDYFRNLYLFCIINIVITIILSFTPWRLEINYYDKILSRFRPNNKQSDSMCSTQNASKIQENNENSFKKHPTEIIIVCNDGKLNLNVEKNINNSNNNNNNKKNENNNKIIINSINININVNDQISRDRKSKVNNKTLQKADTNTNNRNIKDINEGLNQIFYTSEGDSEKRINMNNPQYSNDLFILEDNKNMNKLKKKKNK